MNDFVTGENEPKPGGITGAKAEHWPVRYNMMTWLLLALLLCYIDRVLMSLAVIEMQKDFGWSDTDKGLIFSSFFIGYLITQILGGIVSNRFGGRNTFMVAVLLWSLFTVLTPAAAYLSFTTAVFARFMLGFGEGAAYPAAYNLIHGWMRVTERSRAIGLMTAAGAGGTIIALLTVGQIIERYGWPSVFYIFGSMGIVWAVAWLYLVPSVPPQPDDQAVPEANIKSKRTIPWKVLLLHRSVVALYVLCAAGASVTFTLVSWLPSYFVDTFGLSVSEAGFYSVLPFVAMAIVPVVTGRYADKMVARKIPVIKIRKGLVGFGLLVVAACLTALTLAPSSVAAVIIVCGLFVGLGTAVIGYSPVPAELLPEHGDILFGFMAAVGSLASAGVLALTGLLLESTGSYNTIFVSMAGLTVVGMLAFQIFGRVTPIVTFEDGHQDM